MPRLLSLRLAVPAAALAVAALLGAGCGESEPPWYADIQDLDRVPVSADLAPALAAAVASLDDPPAIGPIARDLETYEDLKVRLRRPDDAAAAGDEVYRLWEIEPDHFLWIELAKNNNRHLRRTDDLMRMCSLPQLGDTTTALGAYVQGRLRYRQTDRGQMYRRAEARMAELDTFQQIWLGLKLASVDFAEGDAIGAVRRLIGWLPAARKVGGAQLETVLWSAISSRLVALDRLDDGLQAAVMAGAKARQANNVYRALRADIKVADVMAARQEYGGARELLVRATATAQREGFVGLVQELMSRTAEVDTELGEYERALELDRRNLALSIAREDPLNLPRNLASIAHDHRMLGDLDSCYVYLQRAARWVDQDSDRRNRSTMASFLAEYHLLVGEYAAADSLLAIAENLSSTSGTQVHEARLLLEMIPGAIEMGRADRAYAWLARVAELESSLRDGGFEQNLKADYEILTTRLLAYQGEYGRAVEALHRAEREVARGGGEGKLPAVRLLAGELAQLRGDLVAARKAYAAALDLAETEGHSEQIHDGRTRLAGVLVREGRYDEVRDLFAAAEAEEAFGTRFRNRLAGLMWLGKSYAGQRDHARALECFERALDLCTPHSPLDLVARLKIEKSRSLIRTGRGDEAGPILVALHDRLAQDADRPRRTRRQLFQAESLREAAELLIGLRLDHPGRFARRDSASATLELAWPCLAGPDAPLPTAVPGEVRLLFFTGSERSFAWAIDEEKTRVRELPGRDELRRQLTPWLADLSTPGRPIDATVARNCARLLLAPAARIWQAGETLRVLPDGLLHDVPWAGLVLPPEFGDPRDRYALEHGPVLQWTATAFERDRPRSSPQDCTLLALGCDDPDAGGGATARLRRAEQEARRTAATWPGPHAEVRIGAEASWSRLADTPPREFDVIHLATHAVVYPGRPQRSTLRLSSGADGEPVTPGAVAALDLDAQLVFLSCCNAARRLSTTGGGASDFGEAFRAAGARTVIASTLWVDDEASEHLAQAFYRNWAAGMGKAEALRASLLQLREAREEWKHPAYWAFYRLSGDPD